MSKMKCEMFAPKSSPILVTGPTIFLFPSSLLHITFSLHNRIVDYSGATAMYMTTNPMLEPSLQHKVVTQKSAEMGSSSL